MEKVTIEIDDKYADAFQFTCIGGLGSKSVNISNGVYVLRNGTNFVVDSKGSPRQERIPAVDAAPVKHGKWEGKQLDNFKKYQVACSNCGWIGIENYDSYNDPSDFNYCPNCGAKMDGGEDDAAD